MHFKILPSPPSASLIFGQVHLEAYWNKAEHYCNPCRRSVCSTSTHTRPAPLEHSWGASTPSWPACLQSCSWQHQQMGTVREPHWVKGSRLKISHPPEGPNYNCGIVFVHKLWRYSDFSCRSSPLFQGENIFPFISVHKQVLSACGILILPSLTFCSTARHGSRNPVSETVTQSVWRSKETFQFLLLEKAARQFSVPTKDCMLTLTVPAL